MQGDEILENELRRIEAGEKTAGMDTKRYNLDPPPAAKRNDYGAWRAALDNAYSQLEHQYNRCVQRCACTCGRYFVGGPQGEAGSTRGVCCALIWVAFVPHHKSHQVGWLFTRPRLYGASPLFLNLSVSL